MYFAFGMVATAFVFRMHVNYRFLGIKLLIHMYMRIIHYFSNFRPIARMLWCDLCINERITR